jgi:predicted nucleotidyltransferase
MTDFDGLLRLLAEGNVEFILIGGVAATAHGSARYTADLDVVYRRTPENISRLVGALASVMPYLRGAPRGLPFRWDAETIAHGLNFTLVTSLGDIDVLGEIVGGGTYEELKAHCVKIAAWGVECLCLNLDMLIYVKRAAGRPKDFEAIAELEALREEQGGGKGT